MNKFVGEVSQHMQSHFPSFPPSESDADASFSFVPPSSSADLTFMMDEDQEIYIPKFRSEVKVRTLKNIY